MLIGVSNCPKYLLEIYIFPGAGSVQSTNQQIFLMMCVLFLNQKKGNQGQAKQNKHEIPQTAAQVEGYKKHVSTSAIGRNESTPGGRDPLRMISDAHPAWCPPNDFPLGNAPQLKNVFQGFCSVSMMRKLRWTPRTCPCAAALLCLRHLLAHELDGLAGHRSSLTARAEPYKHSCWLLGPNLFVQPAGNPLPKGS